VSSGGQGRVLGWDVLRGLCALAVASYHLMYWQGLPSLYTFGSYGVYLFFVLSGASLAYTYEGRLASWRDAGSFLATRWLRLAPLYFVLCMVFVGLLSVHLGHLTDQLPFRLALNATFAFGVYDPATWALLIGGWSLGIEFVYYLVFPLLLAAVARPATCALLAVALAALQWYWIVTTAGSPEGYEASSVAYHQVPAFAAYFFGGCVIGHWRKLRDHAWPQWAGACVWIGIAALLLALNPTEEGDQLLGVRGAVLFAACFVVVYASGQVAVQGRLAPVARWLGDITYGCYLLHPMFFFGFTWFVLPRFTAVDIADMEFATRCLVLVAVLVASCALATASERWFERPVRQWGRRLFTRRRLQARPA